MPEVHKPRSGSLQYWPRKRAARIIPSVSIDQDEVDVDSVKPLTFPAYKAGMTQAIILDKNKGAPTFNQNVSVPVSVLDSPPLLVLGFRVYSRSGRSLSASHDVFADNISSRFDLDSPYSADDVDADEAEDIRLIVATQPEEAGLAKKTPEVFEIDISGSVEEKLEYARDNLGSEIEMGDVFEEGQFTDVTSITRGQGFEGVVKRFGVKVRGRKDEKHHRMIGNIGTEGTARVLYTVPRPGQKGFQQRTENNKRIIKMGEEGFSPKGGFVNYGEVPGQHVFLKGSVPGPKKRLIFLRAPSRAPATRPPFEFQEVLDSSQQGRGTR